MMLAWALSLACEALLFAALVRYRRLDWWTAFIAYDIVRGLGLRQMDVSSTLYAHVWIATEIGSILLQFLAVGHATRGTSRAVGIAVAAAVLGWSVALTPEDWNTTRRAGLMLRQASVFGCLGALLSARSGGWPLGYYVMRSLRAIIEQIAATPERVGTVNTIALWASAAFFLAWAVSIFCSEKADNPS